MILTRYPECGHEVPWDEIEPGIIPRLRILIDAGFKTFASCEGHDGLSPWIRIEGSDVEGIHDALQAGGESGYTISIVYCFPAQGVSDHCCTYTQVHWWFDSIERRNRASTARMML